ncbi:MAG: PQQ-binding-like beta-propeller repeat protein [Planctomycetes bacterium]|nr:PQQ-binding-like beta-propeller repeat protein [Planctomycetota bacterium]
MRRFLSRGVAWFAVAVLPAAVAVAGGTLLCGTAGDDLVAARAGLVREWVVQIPFDSAGWSLETVSIGDGLVVATSGDGGVHAVSTGTGPGLPRPGSVLWSRHVGDSVGRIPPAGVADEAIADSSARSSGRYQDFDPPAGDGGVGQPPVAFAGGVVWSDTTGMLKATVKDEKQWRQLEFDLGAPVTGGMVVRDRSIFVATQRGDLFRIDEPDGAPFAFKQVWRVTLPYQPEAGPIVGGDTVAISLGGDGIMAFSAVDGRERWRSCHGGRLVSITGNRVWCIDAVGRLSSLDLETGMPGEWMCLGSFTLPVVNTVNDRLILASPDGLLVSLAPRRTVSAVPPPGPPQPNWKPVEESTAPAPEAVEPAAAEPVADPGATET